MGVHKEREGAGVHHTFWQTAQTALGAGSVNNR